jgi:hypothetical protein
VSGGISSGLGLAYGSFTLVLALGLTGLWLVSLVLLYRRDRGWRSIPLSLLGWSWIGFGLAFVARFWVLSIDAVNFGDMSERLVAMPPSVIDQALLLSLLYWGSVLLAYRLVPVPRVNPLSSVDAVAGGRRAVAAFDALAVIAVVAMVLEADVERTPPALVRPLSLIGSLWVVPAVSAWFLALRDGRPRLAVRRWIYLLPGLVSFALEPFRERLLLMLLIPLIAALCAGRRPRLAPLLLVLAIFAITSTLAVSWYRQVVWDGESVMATNEYLDPAVWRKDPYYAPWTALLRRFHSFDSLVFHAYLVPDVVPFEERNPFLDMLLEGFVPRALWPDKPESRRAMIFSVTLWSYGEEDRGAEANIAPSMAGDLYGVGGWLWVALGAAAWGVLLAVLDCWRERLSPGGQAVVIAMLALLAAGGIERDFPRAAATLLQSAIVLAVATVVLRRALGPGRARPGGSPSPAGEWSREPAQVS